MIFVTVGYQMSFDRMVKAVDEWAKRNPGVEIFAQIGPTDFVPENMPHTRFLSPDEFRIRIEEATLLVAHAGMGSILTAMEMQKPIVIMPRRGDLQETRNDHQIATLKKMAGRPGIRTAMDSSELIDALDRRDDFDRPELIRQSASDELLDHLRAFIHHD